MSWGLTGWRDIVARHADKARAALAELARSSPGRPPSGELLVALKAVDLTEDTLALGRDGIRSRLHGILRSSSSLISYSPAPVACDILLYEAEGTSWPYPLFEIWKPVVNSIEYRGDTRPPWRPPDQTARADPGQDLAEILRAAAPERER